MSETDYLEWELERQRRALRALLLGGPERREDGPEEEIRRRPAELEAAGRDAAGRAGQMLRREAPADPGGGEAVRRASRDRPRRERGALESPEGAGRRVPETGALERTAAESPADPGGGERETPPLPKAARPAAPREAAAWREGTGETSWKAWGGERTAPGGGGGAMAESGSIPPAADGGGRILETGRRGAPWERSASAALQAEDAARALSQVVQRDARRYDGGFTIY